LAPDRPSLRLVRAKGDVSSYWVGAQAVAD